MNEHRKLTTLIIYLQQILLSHVGREYVVGIATRYRLDDRWIEIFRTLPDRSLGPPSLLLNGYRVTRGSRAAGAWRWPPTSISAEVKERL